MDKDGNPNFLNADEKIIFKVGVLNGFNLYWNSLDPVESLLVTNADLRVPANKEAGLVIKAFLILSLSNPTETCALNLWLFNYL